VAQLEAIHDHGHAHDHPDHLGHHWKDSKQQFEAGKLGMWLFLSTEILLFGGLFVAYAVWRANHPEIFAYGSQFLDTNLGGLNTAVLLTSSMTMAMAVTFAARGKMTAVVICLVLTLAGAAGFMAIKYIEYNHKIHEGLLPGMAFYQQPSASHLWLPLDELGHQQEAEAALIAEQESAAFAATTKLESEMPAPPANAEIWTKPLAATGPEGFTDSKLKIETSELRIFLPESVIDKVEDAGPMLNFAEHHTPGEVPHLAHPLQDPLRPVNAQKFFTIYFMMTGLHGIHVIAGGIMIGWLIWHTLRGRFSAGYYTPIDLGGLYWHIVDVIWIFLFPLFYLI
jgi:cytochrome c oxidase subunit 3